MKNWNVENFRQIWMYDFEFIAGKGEKQAPVCMVGKEYFTGETIKLWNDDLLSMKNSPIATDSGVLHVAYFASAELGCFLNLDWKLPAHIIDLYAEFRAYSNGMVNPYGNGILGALNYFGHTFIQEDEKNEMRDLILKGGPWSPDDRSRILDYCRK